MPVIKANGYSVTIGRNALKSLAAYLHKQNYSSYFILCDENTLQHCLPLLVTNCPSLAEAQVIEIESGEGSKQIEFSMHIWQTLLENRADKNTLLLNLGGGVVSDLGGFTASVYKRGIDFINVPTTLLAMADASVGGKTGIDFAGIKNTIGTFAQPKGVFIYPPFLSTLPGRHYRNGLAEIYKMALIGDSTLWKELNAGRKTAEQLLTKSVSLKNTIVLRDPFDKGHRRILNFGHTLGHAIESLCLGTEQELLHGEAVAIGMLMESHIAFQKKWLTKTILDEIVSVLSSVFEWPSLVHLNVEELMALAANDKKAKGNQLRFALIDAIGHCRVDVEVKPVQVKKAITYYHLLSA